MMIRIFFSTLEETIDHAKKYGGWIAHCADQTNQWFDPTVYTLTPIVCLLANERRGDAKIGPWSSFEPTHPSHELVAR